MFSGLSRPHIASVALPVRRSGTQEFSLITLHSRLCRLTVGPSTGDARERGITRRTPDDWSPVSLRPKEGDGWLWRGLPGRVVFEDDSSVMSVIVDSGVFLDDHTMAIDPSPWVSPDPTVPKGRSRTVDVVILLLLLAITAVMGWTQMMQSDQNHGLIERKNLTPPPKVESNTEDAKKEVR